MLKSLLQSKIDINLTSILYNEVPRHDTYYVVYFLTKEALISRLNLNKLFIKSIFIKFFPLIFMLCVFKKFFLTGRVPGFRRYNPPERITG